MLDLESEGLGSIPTRGNIFSKFYNPNLHNIARSDSLGFKTKNPNRSEGISYMNLHSQRFFILIHTLQWATFLNLNLFSTHILMKIPLIPYLRHFYHTCTDVYESSYITLQTFYDYSIIRFVHEEQSGRQNLG